MTKRKAVILFSGGLDSTTCLAIAQSEGFECYALSIYYGQCHKAELHAAKKIAKKNNVPHEMITLPYLGKGASSLTNADLETPAYDKKNHSNHIPITYVPARNLLFLSVALSWAESIAATTIFIGVNAIDYSNYPDCRPEFIEAFARAAQLGTKIGQSEQPIHIATPLLHLNKQAIIQKGTALGVDYAATVSCYRADHTGRACGACDACHFRRQGFLDNHCPDPTRYYHQDTL